jgi:formate hydrogenlyase subunit 6/NADH:ubiquinone oxidoreductase subunit I
MFRGMPILAAERCRGHAACADACPSGALHVEQHTGRWTWALDRAVCIACGLCIEACPEQALTASAEFELAARERSALRIDVSPAAAGQESARD